MHPIILRPTQTIHVIWNAFSNQNCSSDPGSAGGKIWNYRLRKYFRHGSFWVDFFIILFYFFYFTFTKQFVSVSWSYFPLTMCYETEKNKSKSIEPVLMYNLQGQHLAANIKIFFLLQVVLLNNLVASSFSREVLAAGQLKNDWIFWNVEFMQFCLCTQNTSVFRPHYFESSQR